MIYRIEDPKAQTWSAMESDSYALQLKASSIEGVEGSINIKSNFQPTNPFTHTYAWTRIAINTFDVQRFLHQLHFQSHISFRRLLRL